MALWKRWNVFFFHLSHRGHNVLTNSMLHVWKKEVNPSQSFTHLIIMVKVGERSWKTETYLSHELDYDNHSLTDAVWKVKEKWRIVWFWKPQGGFVRMLSRWTFMSMPVDINVHSCGHKNTTLGKTCSCVYEQFFLCVRTKKSEWGKYY